MDFKEQIQKLAERIKNIKETISTEEATKTALVLPFIQTLGYDIFNPLEVIPEFVADISTKKNEKVDYCIQKDNEPIIIIECKKWQEDLNLHNTQLERYFSFTKAKFAILTNGIQYKFYTDIDEPNKMDAKPFLTIDLENLKDEDINELKKFTKEHFDKDKIFNTAGKLKYYNEIKQIFKQELQTPSDELIKLFASKVYSGRITERVLNQFRSIVKKALNDTINDVINLRLTAALSTTQEENNKTEELTPEETVIFQDEEKGIITTQAEIEAYNIVVDILKDEVTPERIHYKDNKNFFNVILDNSNRKIICRFIFSPKQKYIVLFDEQKNENKIPIEKIEHIYMFAQQIKKSAQKFINQT